MRKASRNRSPTPTSLLPDEPSAPKTTEDIAKEEDEDEANKERYIKSTKNHGVLGELMDAEADAEATGSFDKMTVVFFIVSFVFISFMVIISLHT